jgi:hypothetical protein
MIFRDSNPTLMAAIRNLPRKLLLIAKFVNFRDTQQGMAQEEILSGRMDVLIFRA